MKKYRRVVIAVRGDTQAGHSGGLLNPETLIPDIGIDEAGKTVVESWRHVEPRPVQKQLWKWHKQDMDDVRHLAEKDEVIFLEMGDLTQGGIFRDDLDENGLNTQVVMSRWNCVPWLSLPRGNASPALAGRLYRRRLARPCLRRPTRQSGSSVRG